MPQLGPPDSDLLSNDNNQDRVAPVRETDRQSNGTKQRPELDTCVVGSKCAEELRGDRAVFRNTHTRPQKESTWVPISYHV